MSCFSAVRKTPARQLQLNSSDEQWLEDLCRVRRSTVSRNTVSSRGSKNTSENKTVPAKMALPWQRLAQRSDLAKDHIIDFLAVAGEIPLPLVRWPRHNSIIIESTVRKASFEYCLSRWAAWQNANEWMLAFKIGIAFDAEHRWWNREFGYVAERRWVFMDVMCSDESKNVRELEWQLIEVLRRFPGCQNEASGGGGISDSTKGTCYCYMVFARAGDGVGLQAAWQQAAGARMRPWPSSSSSSSSASRSS